jgi:hypothetical protein
VRTLADVARRKLPKMPTLANLLIIAATLVGVPPASAVPDIDGKYCGTAWSGGELVEVVTTLTTQANGLLIGSYEFADNGQTTPGTLHEYLKEADDRRTLVWVDKYGTGQLVVTFDGSRDSFTGGWNAYTNPPAYRWDGKRCDLVASR